MSPEKKNKNILILKKGTRERVIFCLYGLLVYRDFAEAIKTDRMVCGVYLSEEFSFIRDGESSKYRHFFSSVENLAEAYLTHIRSFQEKGPYSLCGLSFGGIVALEVARKLVDLGETVEIVALFDSYPPKAISSVSRFNRVLIHLKLATQKMSYIQEKIVTLFRKTVENKKPTRVSRENVVNARRSEIRELAVRNYTPKAFSVKTVLFRSNISSPFIPTGNDYGWSKVLTNIKTYIINGGHTEILKKGNVEKLAQHFLEELV